MVAVLADPAIYTFTGGEPPSLARLRALYAHQATGAAPDGAERWYIHGKEVSRDVNAFFFQNKWSMQRGLNTPQKITVFQAHFLK